MAITLNIGKKLAPPTVTTDAAFEPSLKRDAFVHCKMISLFTKLLRRCQSRTEGLDENQRAALFDSMERGNASTGLNSLLAEAMTLKAQLYLVFKDRVIRKATAAEQVIIADDYMRQGRSSTGVFVDFGGYATSDIVRFYMTLIYRVFQTAEVVLGLSRSMTLKMSNMRSTTSTATADSICDQAKQIVDGLKQGKSAIIDATDMIQVEDLKGESIEKFLQLIYSELANELDMPIAFVSGELTTGMSVTGDADLNAIDAGLETTFYSIYKPILDRLFKANVTYRSENFRKFSALVQLLPEIESSLYLTDDQKKAFVDSIFTED